MHTSPSSRENRDDLSGTPDGRPDVLFVDLPYTTYELGRRFKSAWSFKQFLAPGGVHLGFRYMTTALRDAGFSASIIYPSTDGFRTRDELIAEIVRTQPQLLGFTSYEGSLGETLEFVRRLRERGVTSAICLGGHLATFSYQEILQEFSDVIDLIVLGEGERTIVHVVAALRHGTPLSIVPGIAYWNDARVVLTSPAPVRWDLDSLPYPVVMMPGDASDAPLFVITSRGCYARCTFCRSSHFGERWRPRDPMAVVDEIEQAYRHGVRLFELVDDNFLGPGRRGRHRARAIAEELIRRNLNIRFHASCRVDDVDETTMLALREAGLISLSLGVESGVPRMLETFGKNVTVSQNEAALQLLDRLNILTLAYIIFFDPYTTLEEVRENLTFLRRIGSVDCVRFEEIIFRRLIPVSGTPLFERIRRDGLLRGDYLSGHSFVFQDGRVALLADFLEMVDLRIERAFTDPVYREIPGLYAATKERVEFEVVGRAVDLLEGSDRGEAEELAGLEGIWRDVLHEAFGVETVRP